MALIPRMTEGLKTITIAGIALLLLFHAGGTLHAGGAVFHQIPFQVRPDLEWRLPSQMNHIIIFPNESYSIQALPSSKDLLVSDAEAGQGIGIWQYQKLKVYLSRLSLDAKDIDVQRRSDDAENQVNTFLSLPVMLRNDQYGDVLKSMGEIFKPQLNLGIEF
jgi:hypothetical protein